MQPFGNSFQSLEGLFLILPGLYWNNHGSLFPSGEVVSAMQMHYNESRCYPGAEVEEESTCSSPVALCSVRSKVLETTRSGCCASALILCNIFIIILASSSCLHHYPSRTWDSALGHSFHCSCLLPASQYD